MLTTKKRGTLSPGVGVALLLLLLLGCIPRGPRALLDGERLIHDGRYAAAIPRLLVATTELPENAQAWNHLGLAYHGNGDPTNALAAYITALRLDRDLYQVRFNLGCLYLEHNNPVQAIDEFRSYLMRTNAFPAHMLLATALLRAGRLDDAERSFRGILAVAPENAQALNQLGLIYVQRERPRDAAQFFQAALQREPDMPAAHLNLAVLSQQSLADLPAALDHYRSYLDARPRPTNWFAVSLLVSRLDNRASAEPTEPATNRPVEMAQTTGTEEPPPTRENRPEPEPAPVRVTKPSPPPERSPPPSATTTTTTTTTPSPSASRAADPRSSPAPKPVSTPPSKPVTKPPPKPEPEEPAKPANRTPPVQMASTTQTTAPTTTVVAPNTRPPKEEPDVATPIPDPTPGPQQPSPVRVEPSSRIPPELLLSRYLYRHPETPSAGDRSSAAEVFNRGLQAQQERRLDEAVAAYQKATELDPSYFDAYYNLGTAAYQAEDLKEALYAFEYALAIKPDSLNARYNFSVALKRANYPQDAAIQLQRLLSRDPSDVRAHFALGNLYASELSLPNLARTHYLRVLELEPQHPRASEIRDWLASHP